MKRAACPAAALQPITAAHKAHMNCITQQVPGSININTLHDGRTLTHTHTHTKRRALIQINKRNMRVMHISAVTAVPCLPHVPLSYIQHIWTGCKLLLNANDSDERADTLCHGSQDGGLIYPL